MLFMFLIYAGYYFWIPLVLGCALFFIDGIVRKELRMRRAKEISSGLALLFLAAWIGGFFFWFLPNAKM